MLTKVTVEDVEKYGLFFYELALDPARSAYPTYTDGIKTRGDFLASLEKSVVREDQESLLFWQDGVLEGNIQYVWIPEDRYLQLVACNIRTGTKQALSELMAMLEERFSGYQIYFGFPGENQEAVSFLEEHGFRCIEADWNHSFFFEGDEGKDTATGGGDPQIAKIHKGNFEDFQAVYRPQTDTYWNCQRIRESLEDWSIYVYYEAGKPVGTVFFCGQDGYFEIFGMEWTREAPWKEACRALLAAALNHCRQAGARYMTFFCEENMRQIVAQAGFLCVGQYLCYVKQI